jgi:hypothetical protein
MKQHPAERLAAWRCDWKTDGRSQVEAAFLALIAGCYGHLTILAATAAPPFCGFFSLAASAAY